MDLSNKSLEELRQIRNGINTQRDALKAQLRPIVDEINRRGTATRTAQLLSKMGPAERDTLRQQLQPGHISSGEKFRTLGK